MGSKSILDKVKVNNNLRKYINEYRDAINLDKRLECISELEKLINAKDIDKPLLVRGLKTLVKYYYSPKKMNLAISYIDKIAELVENDPAFVNEKKDMKYQKLKGILLSRSEVGKKIEKEVKVHFSNTHGQNFSPA